MLYGYQHDDGSVTDENIDGNFVRTVLLYGLSLSRGARLEPWSPRVALGAAFDGSCLRVHLHSEEVWRGALLFDTPRHKQHVGLRLDYPRLNQWPPQRARLGTSHSQPRSLNRDPARGMTRRFTSHPQRSLDKE